MSLYDILVDMSTKHVRMRLKTSQKWYGYTDMFRFDFDKRTVSNGKFNIIEDGVVSETEIVLEDGTEYVINKDSLLNFSGDFYTELERLYEQYRYSVPRSIDDNIKSNFMAEDYDNLSLYHVRNAMRRSEARVRLEAFIILAVMSGVATWKNDDHYFWKSDKDCQLILFKQWII